MVKERKGVSTKVQASALEPKATAYPVPVVGLNAVRGLALQVRPSGSKAFILRYRFEGLQKSLTLGEFPDMGLEQAHDAALDKWAEIRAGANPVETIRIARKPKPAGLTVGDLADRYITEHLPGNRQVWAKEAKRLINKLIRPALGDLLVKELGPADVSTLLWSIQQKTPTQSNRVRAVLRTMFQRAEEWELRPLGSNPVAVVKKRAPEVKRDRRLSDLELKALGIALQASKEEPELILAVRLALLAGMRKGEIQALRWEWVDLDAGLIRLPPEAHKTGGTGKARIVHLCSALVRALRRMPATLGCPWVVPGRPRVDPDTKARNWGPFIGLQTPWERIREAAKLADPETPADSDPGWHDLRRTFASVGSDLGYRGFVGELLGHAEGKVTDIYTRTSANPLQDAAEAIGARIESILSGTVDPEKELEERKAAKRKTS